MKIRMGMVGGGTGAFIGSIHRLAASMTGRIDLVAGAFSRDADDYDIPGFVESAALRASEEEEHEDEEPADEPVEPQDEIQ